MAVVAPEAIINNGWMFYEKCRCHRVKTYKYRHSEKPDLELWWRVDYFEFKIMDRNTTKVPLTKISQLDEILKQL